MSGLDLAGQMRIYANLCDAVDPALSDEQRGTATEAAADEDLEFAYAACVGLFGSLLHDLGAQFGPEAVAEVMAQMRRACGTAEDVTGP
jgi:hypothetical protein